MSHIHEGISFFQSINFPILINVTRLYNQIIFKKALEENLKFYNLFFKQNSQI